MKFSVLTDKGKVRETNQDRCFYEQLDEMTSLAVVCDGMGGNNGGDIASETAAGQIKDHILSNFRENNAPDKLPGLIAEAITKANDAVYKKSCENSELHGMGTTAVVAVICGNDVYIGHVGDSRAYIFDGKLTKITKDHSLVQYLVDTGVIKPEEAATHPKRNYITRALGVAEDVETDLTKTELPDGARLLLCSDGLYNYIGENVLEKYMNDLTVGELDRSFLHAVYENGAGDNISAVIVENRKSESEK